jgi:hypothetical protein
MSLTAEVIKYGKDIVLLAGTPARVAAVKALPRGQICPFKERLKN